MFSRRKAIVRQLSRSAIRDCAVCRIGALWPSSRPATTTAITPEACISSASDERRERHDQRHRAVEHRVGDDVAADLGDHERSAEADQHAAAGGDARSRAPTSSTSSPVPAATASAVRSATSAVASLSSDSPSRIVMIRRGSPIRRPIAVAATASGGATTAPIANASAQDEVGQQQLGDDRDPGGGEDDQPDRQQQDRPAVGVEVDERRALRGGVEQRRQQPEEHDLLGLRWICGTCGTYDAATPTTTSRSGAGRSIRLGDRRADQHRDGHAAEQQGDLHARNPCSRGPVRRAPGSARRGTRRSCAADHGLDDLDAAVGVGQRVLELGEAVDPPVRRAGRRAERREVDAVRGAEEPLERVRVLGRALLEHREDRAAVVVDDHDRQVRPRLVGAEHQPVAVVQERHVAHQREVAVPPWRRPSAAPIAVETVPSMPDRPRLAITLRRPPTS